MTDTFRSFPKPQKVKKERRGIRKIGKRGRINLDANKKLKKVYEGMLGICEIRGPNCWHVFQGFAHRHKRNWYRGREDLLSSYDETIRACNICHQMIEASRELTEMYFNMLRPITNLSVSYVRKENEEAQTNEQKALPPIQVPQKKIQGDE